MLLRKALFVFFGAGLFALAVLARPSAAQNIQAFEGQLDETIRAACHSYMVDALPSSLSWLRDQIYEGSAFCNKVKAAYDREALGDVMQSAFKQATSRGGDLDLSKKHDRDLNVTIQCDAEYMCIESRMRFLDTKTPVSQKQYDKVAVYCGGRYGCIQAFFDDWPRDIPAPAKKNAASAGGSGLSFADLLGGQASGAPTSSGVTAGGTPSVPAPQIKLVTTSRPSADLLKQNGRVSNACKCSNEGRPCFDNPQGPIRTHIARLEARRSSVCTSWQSNYGTMNSSSAVDADTAKADLDAVWQDLVAVDTTARDIIKIASDWFYRMSWHVRNNKYFNEGDYTPRVDAMVRKVESRPIPALGGSSAQTSPPAQSASTSTGANGGGTKALHVGPRLSYAQAESYCRQRGMTLPTVAQAKERLAELRQGDPFFGVWTTDQTQTDRAGNRRRAQMNNGFTEGFPASESHRTVCFPA